MAKICQIALVLIFSPTLLWGGQYNQGAPPEIYPQDHTLNYTATSKVFYFSGARARVIFLRGKIYEASPDLKKAFFEGKVTGTSGLTGSTSPNEPLRSLEKSLITRVSESAVQLPGGGLEDQLRAECEEETFYAIDADETTNENNVLRREFRCMATAQKDWKLIPSN